MFASKTALHINCCIGIYLNSSVQRFAVPEQFVSWTTSFPGYKPPFYDSPVLHGKPWADPAIGEPSFQPQWNCLDGTVNRKSHIHSYNIDDDNYPINPIGRTGLRGRGLLGRWGPNHAADPIITRWKRNTQTGEIVKHSDSKNILQLITIQRRDNQMWALPGGMVDPGENIGETLRREFMEEAMNTNDMPKRLKEFFATGGESVYVGYVDDHRNTDNAWIETVARNFHDSDGSFLTDLRLEAGDDAGSVRWTDVSDEIVLYANHKMFVQNVCQKLNAHW